MKRIFQVVHPRCVCQIIQYVFIVSTTLYINILVHLFMLYINYMFRPLRMAIFRFQYKFL